MTDWLRRLKHDLLKQPLWRARDLAADGPPSPADLEALRRIWRWISDDDGHPVGALARAAQFRDEVWEQMNEAQRAAWDQFHARVKAADAAVEGTDPQLAIDAVLALEPESEALARTIG